MRCQPGGHTVTLVPTRSKPAETCVTIDSATHQTRAQRLKGFMELLLFAINL